jgi:hypothetical protein
MLIVWTLGHATNGHDPCQTSMEFWPIMDCEIFNQFYGVLSNHGTTHLNRCNFILLKTNEKKSWHVW